MFRTILSLSYLIPNIYLFIRIWQLFIPGKFRTWYMVIYGILFSVYPLTRIAGREFPEILMQVLSTLSNYLLPFFLYLFLFVLLTDILLLINKLTGIIRGDVLKEQSLRLKILFAIISLSAAVVIAGIINFNVIRTSEYRISIPARSSHIGELRIAFVSDFHIGENTPYRFMESFVKKVQELDPDLMLYGGDIVEGGRGAIMDPYETILRKIKPRYGVYGVLGNHEHYSRQDDGDFFSNAGIKILADTSVLIDNSFILAGRHDSHTRTRIEIAEFMDMVADTLPVILMDHRPTEIDQISRTKADVVFSGHTHHGQLFPINIITGIVYELSHGYLRKGETHFFVSSGIRLWGPPVRTTARSEIVLVDIEFTGS